MPALSSVSICNAAILSLGGNPISSLTENTKEAILCNALYDMRLWEVLEAHTWNFAKKWVALADVSSTYTFVDSEYSYAYALPSDYVRMSRMEELKTQYAIRGRYLLCNLDECNIEYIQYNTTVPEYPTHFVMALEARLRADLALPLARKGAKSIDYLAVYYSNVLPEARFADSRNGEPSEDEVHRHTDARDTWLAAR